LARRDAHPRNAGAGGRIRAGLRSGGARHKPEREIQRTFISLA
jgi:hypothetical protein